tara:strand:- start:4104 stop:5339 length:1236 start_codon:yes stop_codon:yes gene_type:complete
MVSLKGRVSQDLPRFVSLLRDQTGSLNTAEQLADWGERVRHDPRAWLSANKLVDPDRLDEVVRLLKALDQSQSLLAHMKTAASVMKEDSRLREACFDLVTNQDRFDGEAQDYLMQRLLENDELLSGTLYVMLNDPEVRSALGVSETTSAEAFLVDLKKAIKTSDSASEAFQKVPGGKLLALTCTPAVVCAATVFVFVHAYVAIYTIAAIFIVAKTEIAVPSSVSVSGAGLATNTALIASPVASQHDLHNLTGEAVWVVIETDQGLRRAALPAGARSSEVGIATVEALLVGGEGNPVRAYASARTEASGLGVVHIRPKSNASRLSVVPTNCPGQVTITGAVDLLPIEYECYEHFEGEPPYHVSTIAAIAPIGFNHREAREQSRGAERFYIALRSERILRRFSERGRSEPNDR